MSFFFDPLERGSFDLVQVDFPWPWETWSASGRKKSPQYDCMTLDEIADTHADELLAPGGVMVMWGTWPLIGPQHLICENAFGLKVKTGGCWSKRTKSGKLRVGTGHILRSVCEPFLVACRPNHKLKARGAAYNLIETLDHLEVPGIARESGRKPEEMHELLEKLTPGWRRADIFSRQSRKGWRTFGRERHKFDAK
jgi:N6-adenosine-specific RNA methylase IME4